MLIIKHLLVTIDFYGKNTMKNVGSKQLLVPIDFHSIFFRVQQKK